LFKFFVDFLNKLHHFIVRPRSVVAIASLPEIINKRLPLLGNERNFVFNLMKGASMAWSTNRPTVVNVIAQSHVTASNEMSTISATPMKRMIAAETLDRTRFVRAGTADVLAEKRIRHLN